MQKGADPWQAAGYLGMSLEVLLNTYATITPIICQMQSKKSRCASLVANERHTYLARFLVR
jgi:hypothetical protein